MEASSRLNYHGYEAWIEVDGQALQCYSTNVDHAKNIVTCWIASEIGKAFSIGWRPNNTMISHQARAYLDGMHAGSRCYGSGSKRRDHFIRKISTSDTMEVPFMFSVLELTDDDNYLKVAIADLGEIKLSIDSIKGLVQREAIKKFKKHQIPTVEKVYEQFKKAMAHRVSFGDEQLSERRNPRVINEFQAEACLVTFIFRYRPLDALQANGIAPCISDSGLVVPSQENQPSSSTSNQPSKGKRKATELKEGVQKSIKRFEDRENALHAELSRLKDEKERFLLAELEKLRKDKYFTNDSAPRKKVKIEAKPLFLPGEVIDLT